MDAIVHPDFAVEIEQILSSLLLGDNTIRGSAEKALLDRVSENADLCILALAHHVVSANSDATRSLSLVLVRRLLSRQPSFIQEISPNSVQMLKQSTILYDTVASVTLDKLAHILLYSLLNEPSGAVRRQCVDTITELDKNGSQRGRDWLELHEVVFHLTESDDTGLREAAFNLFAGSPMLMIENEKEVLDHLKQGLQDNQHMDVRFSALRASTEWLIDSFPPSLAHSASLIFAILDMLPSIPVSLLPKLLAKLTVVAEKCPALFEPHLQPLLTFLPPLLLSGEDVSTPTGAEPSSAGQSFNFPPESSPNMREANSTDEGTEATRKAALEFMVTLTEAKAEMLIKAEGWVEASITACLERMCELRDESLNVWLETENDNDLVTESYPLVYEQSLARLACALGGDAAIPIVFKHITSMAASPEWQLRHASMMAIAVISKGTAKVMQTGLQHIISLVMPLLNDAHPRVRFAACRCVGKICKNLRMVTPAKDRCGDQFLVPLIPVLGAAEIRVRSEAVATMAYCCQWVSMEQLVPYLDSVVGQLLNILTPSEVSIKPINRYEQEQAMSTLAKVADICMIRVFTKYYRSTMPLLLKLLRYADKPQDRVMRIKTLECLGLVAKSVGRDVFQEDEITVVDLLVQIQNSRRDPDDTMLDSCLINTWVELSRVLGPEFEPYLPIVMPPLLEAAGRNADPIILQVEELEDSQAWKTITYGEKTVGVRSSAMEEKSLALHTIYTYCMTLQSLLGPYLTQCLEAVIPTLQSWFDPITKMTCGMIIPVLLQCGKIAGTLTSQIASITLHEIIKSIHHESEFPRLRNLMKCLVESMDVVGGPSVLSLELQNEFAEAVKKQLPTIAKWRSHSLLQAPSSTRVPVHGSGASRPERQDFTLDTMTRLLQGFDPNHPVLEDIAIAKTPKPAKPAKTHVDYMAQMLRDIDPTHPLLPENNKAR